jgi:uncharacterized cupin superfamily protein
MAPSDAVDEEPGQYPGSPEILGYGRPVGRVAGLRRLGLHVERLPPGHRLSYPHAEGDEEEFVFVLDGHVDAWIDGHLHPMRSGDLAAFPAGTGIAHTFINNGDEDVLLLVGGEASKPGNRIYYPLDPERRAEVGDAWWADAPARAKGGHDGLPDGRKGSMSPRPREEATEARYPASSTLTEFEWAVLEILSRSPDALGWYKIEMSLSNMPMAERPPLPGVLARLRELGLVDETCSPAQPSVRYQITQSGRNLLGK